MIYQPLQQWGPVSLVGLAAEDSEPFTERAGLAFVFESIDPPDIWPCDAIIKNWRLRMNARYVRATEAAERATLAHTDKLRAWIDQTRSIASDLRAVYGDRLACVLETAANDLQESVSWPELRIDHPPNDPKGRAELFLTVEHWAFDRVRATIEGLCHGKATGIPGKDAGRTILLTPAINILKDAGLPHMKSDEGWKMRVRRLKVKPGQEENLVGDVLEACRSGPFDSQGRENPPA